MLVRPLIARVPLDDATWWPETIVPPLVPAIGLLVAVQVAGVVGALVSLRRLTVTPLGVQRRSVPPRPGVSRLVPLGASIVGLLAATWGFRSGGDLGAAILVGICFAAVIGSIAAAGPWLTALTGRLLHRVARGASGLLAARRIDDDPRGSFGAIAGVIMAVFVASVFFTFMSYVRAESGRDTDPLLQPDAIVAYLGSSAGGGRDIVADLETVPGVTAVLPVREIGLLQGEGIVLSGWLADCEQTVDVLGLQGATCPSSGLATASGFEGITGDYTVIPEIADPTGEVPVRAPISIRPGDTVPLMTDEGDAAGFLPALLIDPSALDDPSAAEAFPVSRIQVLTDGSDGVGERVRTAIVRGAPSAFVRLEAERVAAERPVRGDRADRGPGPRGHPRPGRLQPGRGRDHLDPGAPPPVRVPAQRRDAGVGPALDAAPAGRRAADRGRRRERDPRGVPRGRHPVADRRRRGHARRVPRHRARGQPGRGHGHRGLDPAAARADDPTRRRSAASSRARPQRRASQAARSAGSSFSMA